jgi:hypothetical protein
MKLILVVFMFLTVSAQVFAADSGFKHQSELGATLIDANRDSDSWNAKHETTYTFSENLLKLNLAYLRTATENLTTQVKDESARSWLSALRYERALSEYFSVLAAYQIEGDITQAYLQKNSADVVGKKVVTLLVG